MSIAELLVIFIVALLVLRQENINKLAQLLAKLTKQVQGLKKVFDQKMDEHLKQEQLRQNLAKAEMAEQNNSEVESDKSVRTRKLIDDVRNP